MAPKYDFGGVFGGKVNIVENGDLFMVAVDKTDTPGEVRSLLKDMRRAADESELPDQDKHTVAAQLAGIVAELSKDEPERSRIDKAVGIIKAVAEGAKPVAELVVKIAPLLASLG